MTEQDPQRVLDENPMNWRQYVVVAIMVALNALDGFDVLSSAFAAPGISKEWGVSREALGIVLSAELVGMGFGSVILAEWPTRLAANPPCSRASSLWRSVCTWPMRRAA